jgi:hypothetical protein
VLTPEQFKRYLDVSELERYDDKEGIMMTWVAAGFLAAVRLRAAAEDPVESRVQRYKEQLNLTDEQLPKIREIVKKQIEDMKAVLTDEQKTRLDRRRRRGSGQQRPGQPGQRPAATFKLPRRPGCPPPTTSRPRSASPTTRSPRSTRSATPSARRCGPSSRTAAAATGGQNLAEDFNAFMEKSKEETTRRSSRLLTDEQKPKFDEAVKAFAANQPARPRTVGNRAAAGYARRARRPRHGEPQDRGRQGADAVKGLVKKVMEVMERLEPPSAKSAPRSTRPRRTRTSPTPPVGEKITKIMKDPPRLEKELAAARKGLTEVVTNRRSWSSSGAASSLASRTNKKPRAGEPRPGFFRFRRSGIVSRSSSRSDTWTSWA